MLLEGVQKGGQELAVGGNHVLELPDYVSRHSVVHGGRFDSACFLTEGTEHMENRSLVGINAFELVIRDLVYQDLRWHGSRSNYKISFQKLV